MSDETLEALVAESDYDIELDGYGKMLEIRVPSGLCH